MPFELPFLFAAGFFGSMLNSMAGGGTFITFPALLFVGVPPISANATNTFASCSGYISGAYGFRRELRDHRDDLPRFVLISLLGGTTGAWLLLQTPELLFREAIAGGYLAARISRRTPQTYVKGFVIISSTVVTLYFFYDTYVS